MTDQKAEVKSVQGELLKELDDDLREAVDSALGAGIMQDPAGKAGLVQALRHLSAILYYIRELERN